MADILCNKLLHSLSSNSSRFPPFSLPLTLSPRSNFSFIRFTSLKRTRLCNSSLLVKLSSDSAQFDIISTSEQSDGSVVFKFGDASEIPLKIEHVDCTDTESVVLGTSDGGDDVSDANLEVVGTSGGENSVNGTKLDIVGTSESEDDVSDAKSEVLGTTDGEDDGSDAKLEVAGTSCGEQSVNGTQAEIAEASDGEYDVKDAKVELLGDSDVEDDHSDAKLEVGGPSCGEQNVSGTKLEIARTSDGEHDVKDAKSELLGNSDVEDYGLEVVETSSVEQSGNGVKLPVAGTSEGGIDVNDAKSEEVGTSDGEDDGSDATLEVEGTSGGEHSVNGVNLDIVGTSDVDGEMDDVKSEVLGTSDGEDDGNDASLEVVGTSVGEQSVDGLNSDFVGTSDVEVEVNDVKSEVLGTSDREDDGNDAILEVVGTLDEQQSGNGVESDIVGISVSEHDVNDVKSELLGTSDGEHVDNDAKLELVGTLEGECEAQLEGGSVSVVELAEVSDSDCTKVEQSVEGEPEEIVITSIMQTTELVGSRDETAEASTDYVVDLQSGPQCNGDSFEDEQDHNLMLTTETENSNDSETMDHDVETSSLKTRNTSIDVIMEDSSDSEIVRDDVEIDTFVPTSDYSAALTVENSEVISPVKAVTVRLTSQLESDQSESLDIAGITSHVETSDTIVSLENSELDGNGEHVVTADDDSNKSLELAEMNLSIEASEIAVSLEHSEVDSNVKDVVTEYNASKSLEIAETNSHVEASDVVVSLGHNELDSNVKHVVNEDYDSVELMQEPVQLETEPILLAEHYDSMNDVVVSESVLDFSMVNDAAPSIIAQHDDDPSSGHMAETYLESVNSMEFSTRTLSISSAAASLYHPSEALTGGEDAYFVCQNWFGVADGVGQWSLGGTNEGQYAQEFMQNCEKLVGNGQTAGLTNVKEVLQQSASMTQSTGSARILIAHFANQVLHVANIGDSGFVIIRNGTVFSRSSPMVHEFSFPHAISFGDDPLEAAEEYHIELEDGDVIITATDGLFDNLYEQEIASIVSRSMGSGMEPKDIAELLVVKAQEVGRSASARSPFADAAQAAGHTGYNGGKLDHVTVIVSLVQTT